MNGSYFDNYLSFQDNTSNIDVLAKSHFWDEFSHIFTLNAFRMTYQISGARTHISHRTPTIYKIYEFNNQIRTPDLLYD